MAKKIVTLYIEDTEIKVLVSRGRKIEKWASFVLEPSLVRDGAILDEAKVAEAIKELFGLQKISGKKVTVALSGLNSIFRYITLPQLPQKMIPEAIINEASRVIPMPLEEVYLTHQVLSSSHGELRVFLAAYRRELTDSLMRTLSKAGLKTEAVDLAPLALARTVNEPKAIIVNSWLSNLDIVILVDQLPQVVRSISLSGDEMSTEEKSSAVKEEFERTISFYNSSHKDNPLDTTVPVFMCGDLTQDEILWQTLNLNIMDYNISAIAPPVEAPEAFISCQYMVNIGLALKHNLPGGTDNRYSIIDINALPEAYIPPSFSWYRILIPVVTVTAMGGLFYFWLVIQTIEKDTALFQEQTGTLNAQVNQIRSQINTIETSISEQEEEIISTQPQKEALQNQIQQNKNLAANFDQTADMFISKLQDIDSDLPELLALKPEGITVADIERPADFMTINGSSGNETQIYDYARALRASERFNSVDITSINRSTVSGQDETDQIICTFTILIQE
jgi:type IV pilus assembly protein PilM